MATKEKSFRNSLICENAIQGQKESAETLIHKQLFKIVYEYDLENGNTITLSEMVEIISDRLGLHENKEFIEQYVREVLNSGRYRIRIDDKGIIREVLNKIERKTKEFNDKQKKEAELKLAEFVELVEAHISQLVSQKINVNEKNIREQFSELQRERNPIWIDLAIDKVLREREQIEL